MCLPVIHKDTQLSFQAHITQKPHPHCNAHCDDQRQVSIAISVRNLCDIIPSKALANRLVTFSSIQLTICLRQLQVSTVA